MGLCWEDINIKIISYKISINGGLTFNQITLQEVNLFVGLSGSGKTKLLNTLFDVARFVVGTDKREGCLLGCWEIEVQNDNKRFIWEYQGEDIDGRGPVITTEKIRIIDVNTNQEELLVDRNINSFKFKSTELPKLTQTSSSIFLLKEEEIIKPFYEGWTKVIRRNFSGAELTNAAIYTSVPKEIKNLFQTEEDKNKGLHQLFNHNLNLRLYLIKKHFNEKYNEITERFMGIFPFVKSCIMKDTSKIKDFLLGAPLGFTPVFLIKEAGIENELPLYDLASGMVKVLLILTDILTLPEGAIYLMDEYENSLGLNAIDFLPGLLLEHRKNEQFLITSHHPYLINKMPVSNWYVLSRTGMKIDIKFGDELVRKYKKSSQESFTQLMNDPFFNPENK